ncbi:Uncharacterised protein [Corynebacterium kutscheri]|uniref:Secreted protein n=1 Tax=Corynebacterium kutscheri TaxID=35755 RepID=A0A0F6R205_9CORY|nr:hypothetical protein [Corynebacterium kutscheri]AKE41338.1 hypothetical protein UL82_05815 [Corynebacterium kutscheri]VEH08614.1 Uncharacterised protein [Corynebacterium kutscheri]VEH09660.1 Uncharacterised protein [Corynebacterium kutscheri]VEH79743.1 Uncharacterised protein [Corynebacterium kutscheri]
MSLRKGIAAVATATALTCATVSVPAHAETTTQEITTQTTAEKQDSGSSSNLDVKEIAAWASIVSTIIGIATALLTFTGKLQNFLK